ncbi:polyprenyl synthetase family protein [Tamaricihabitans halophyticus]|uniref:polyprenyl synthetase family protein n=1 Tax=Tamaricihabitans halophyticus TaxID=1262583 RepID=UPI003C74CF9D
MPAHPASHPIDEQLPTEVARVLRTHLTRLGEPLRTTEPSFADPVDALTDFVLGGGKRLRPTFAWWGWRGAGGDPTGPDTEQLLCAVSSLELIQACALVHDDLMDSSDTRRGAPTVHIEFGRRHREAGWLGSAEQYGLAGAVLIGDLALAWADDMFYRCGLPEARLASAAPAWHAMRSEMLAGQYLDVLTQARGSESVDAALRIDQLKTAAYTVARPLHIGAALAGADESLIAALRQFGADIGVAFQLRDDMLGVFGDPAVTGKPAGDDLREGKRTVLLARGLEYAAAKNRDAEARRLRSYLGKAELTEQDVFDARQLLVELGAVDAVERQITELTESALAALASAGLAEPAGERLRALAMAATKRES